MSHKLPIAAITLAWLASLLGCGPGLIVARGELVAVEREEAYEPICSFLSRYITHCEDTPRAYEAVVLADTAWPKFKAKKPKQHFMFFAPADNAIPVVGWLATWILHRQQLVRLSTCTLYGCQSDVGHALQSDGDVRSYHDFRKIVDSIAGRQVP